MDGLLAGYHGERYVDGLLAGYRGSRRLGRYVVGLLAGYHGERYVAGRPSTHYKGHRAVISSRDKHYGLSLCLWDLIWSALEHIWSGLDHI